MAWKEKTRLMEKLYSFKSCYVDNSFFFNINSHSHYIVIWYGQRVIDFFLFIILQREQVWLVKAKQSCRQAMSVVGFQMRDLKTAGTADLFENFDWPKTFTDW